MKKYRSRKVIDAIQWTDETDAEVQELFVEYQRDLRFIRISRDRWKGWLEEEGPPKKGDFFRLSYGSLDYLTEEAFTECYEEVE